MSLNGKNYTRGLIGAGPLNAFKPNLNFYRQGRNVKVNRSM